MNNKSLLDKLIYLARDLRSRTMFEALRCYSQGALLDVGGGTFYQTAIRKNIQFDSWTVMEISETQVQVANDQRIMPVIGDGCKMTFPDNSFDTVLNIQVLEHVFEPITMIDEMACVLKENGHLILLIPQTSTIHMAPHHYYNFTRFWIEEACRLAGLHILEIKPLGGVWSSMASHLIFFFLQSIRYTGMSTSESKRNTIFYLLYPLMALFALIAFPICLILSLGDLTEEPNNHLVVATKHSKDE